jgi:UDP:flavonoid glycosyltransferase YjiC (YdhE family)
MINILLAGEGGAGLGHVHSLRSIAEALGNGFAFDGVYYLDEALPVLEPVCEEVFRGPALSIWGRSLRPEVKDENWSWANYLEITGFRSPLIIAQQMFWWRSLIKMREIDLVICDYAPRAMLAARTLGIPVALTGTGYGVPPDGLETFPALMNRSAETFVDEKAMIDAVNAACAIRGLAPIRRLPEMFDCDVKLPRGLGFLDPYQGLRREPLLPRPTSFSRTVARDGREVFVYFSNIKDDSDILLEAIGELELPVRAFIPWLKPEKAAALRAAGVIVEQEAVSPNDIARRSRLVVSYGQPATLATGLAAGLPQLAFPQHVEQLVHAERAARTEAARFVPRKALTKASFIDTVRAAYADDGLTAAARRLAPAVRAEMSVDVAEEIRERMRPVLVDIVKRKGLA